MLLLLIFSNVRSERELVLTIPERLDWLQISSDSDDAPKSGTANRKYISTTDPDASVTRRGKGARWLRLWRVQIQEYLISAIQNIMVLLGHIKEPVPALGIVLEESGNKGASLNLQGLFYYFKGLIMKTIHSLFACRPVEAKL